MRNEDKRRAALEAIRNHPSFSDRALAESCGVSSTLVGKLRKRHGVAVTAREGRDGRVINTAQIGARPSQKAPATQRDDLLLRIDELTAERDALLEELAEVRLAEVTAADFAASLGARPVTFETEQEFEARLRESAPEPKRRKR